MDCIRNNVIIPRRPGAPPDGWLRMQGAPAPAEHIGREGLEIRDVATVGGVGAGWLAIRESRKQGGPLFGEVSLSSPTGKRADLLLGARAVRHLLDVLGALLVDLEADEARAGAERPRGRPFLPTSHVGHRGAR